MTRKEAAAWLDHIAFDSWVKLGNNNDDTVKVELKTDELFEAARVLKFSRDYEDDYWRAQWLIDQYAAEETEPLKPDEVLINFGDEFKFKPTLYQVDERYPEGTVRIIFTGSLAEWHKTRGTYTCKTENPVLEAYKSERGMDVPSDDLRAEIGDLRDCLDRVSNRLAKIEKEFGK